LRTVRAAGRGRALFSSSSHAGEETAWTREREASGGRSVFHACFFNTSRSELTQGHHFETTSMTWPSRRPFPRNASRCFSSRTIHAKRRTKLFRGRGFSRRIADRARSKRRRARGERSKDVSRFSNSQARRTSPKRRWKNARPAFLTARMFLLHRDEPSRFSRRRSTRAFRCSTRRFSNQTPAASAELVLAENRECSRDFS